MMQQLGSASLHHHRHVTGYQQHVGISASDAPLMTVALAPDVPKSSPKK